MKKIKVDHIKHDSNYYCIASGNGSIHKFKNLKSANKYQNQCNRFYSEQLYQINLIYSDLLSIYRQVWICISDSRKDRCSGHQFQERELKHELSNIDSLLDLSFSRPKQNLTFYRIFTDIILINESTVKACQIINLITISKSIPFIQISTNHIIGQINNIISTIQTHLSSSRNHIVIQDRQAHTLLFANMYSQQA